MFVYVENIRNVTVLVNTDQIIKCTQRKQDGTWDIKMTHDNRVVVNNESFEELTCAIQSQIAG